MDRISLFFIFSLIYALQALEIPISQEQNYIFKESNNATITNSSEKRNYRLPTDVKPINYNIKLTPYLDANDDKKFTFDGVVKIEISVLSDVQNITLHAKNLTFDKINLLDETIDFNVAMKKREDKRANFLIIERDDNKEIQKGYYILKIEYTGILHDDMRGFYRSSYINEKGERIWLATTHFEPVDARRAFPCFDEPALKATFEIIIVHDKKYTALSNTPVRESRPTEKNLVQTFFKKTKVMSTYLVAFVVSDFKNKTHPDSHNFTVAARPNAIQHADLALESGLKLLQALENFTRVNYTLEKMDQVAIPDFAAGAMENWGLVLYREKSLLFDDKTLTTNEKQNIVETIAHEFAHQWFGDLVGPKWWKYIWLNEGFANFFQSFITDKVEPEWRSVEQSVVKSIQTSTFDFDCESKTHPINHDVESPEEIRALFDTISYKKGGAVIRMMQHFLSEEVFRNGLTAYLNGTNKYGAADSDDLFDAIQEVVSKANMTLDVKRIMNTWVNSKGYPVVKLSRSNGNEVKVTQERFYTYKPSEEEKNVTHYWEIPINYVTQEKLEFNDTTAQYWLKEASGKLPIKVKNNHFIILNKQHTGYYRVQYDEENWNLISTYLSSGKHKNIHVLNRAQLINDALAFAKQKQLSLPILLNLINHLKNETDYVAWYPGFKTFSWLKSKLIGTETYTDFKEFASEIMMPLIKSVGLEEPADEGAKEYLTKLNRITAIDWACKLNIQMNDTSCATKLQKRLKDWLSDSNKNQITPDLKQVTLCGGLRYAKFEMWESALNKTVSQSTSTDEKKELISALACSSDKNILVHYFNYTLREDSPLENETFTVVQKIHENSEVGVEVALHLLIDRLSAILMKTESDRVFKLINDVSKKITTMAQLQKLQMAEYKEIPKRIITPAVDAARKNIDWINENKDIIKKAIDKLRNGSNLLSSSVILISSVLVLIVTIIY